VELPSEVVTFRKCPLKPGGHWRALEGTGGHWRALEGTGGHWRALEGTGGHWRAQRALYSFADAAMCKEKAKILEMLR
jgi:hypothetical protein